MKELPAIPDTMTLSALQKHMNDFCEAFGWHENTTEQRFLLLVEEVGELAKALRHTLKLQIEVDNPHKPVRDAETVRANLAEEFADVLNYILDLANVFGIDLEDAYRTNIDQLTKRRWV